MGMGTSILRDNDRPEGMGHEIHLSEVEVFPHSLQIPNEILWSQQRRVSGEFGAATAALIVEDDDVAVGERFKIRTDVIYAGTRPTVNHDDCVVTGSHHFVEDLGTTRTSQVAVGRGVQCCLVRTTHASCQ